MPRWLALLSFASGFAAGTSPLFAAPPKLSTLFPPGAQRGQTASVAASATYSHWPVHAWVDRPGIDVAAADEPGKLTVRVAPDAVPGPCWIRLYDDEGASPPRPFIIGTLPELVEQEPNDDFRAPQVLPSSMVVVNGRLGRAGDVDTFAVSLEKGQTLVASAEANRTLGSPMDASLQIVSARGFVLEQNDDYHDLDPQIVFTAPSDGIFLVRIFAFPATPTSTIGFAGGADYVYRLTLTTGSFAEYAYPLAVPHCESSRVELVGWNIPEAARQEKVEPGDAGEQATLFHADIAGTVSVRREANPTFVAAPSNDQDHPQDIELPVTMSGRLDRPRAVHAFRFHAAKGQDLLFRVESHALGFPTDPVLRITDSAGKTLSDMDDSKRGDRDPRLAVAVPADGEFRLLLRDLHGSGGDRYVYRLSATLAEPDYVLKIAGDSFLLTPGKPLEIPVTVERANRFSEVIQITAEGLPEGVSVLPAESLGNGDTAKSVKLTVTATTGPLSSPFRIIGRSNGMPEKSHTALTAIPGLSATTPDLWLTVVHGASDGK